MRFFILLITFFLVAAQAFSADWTPVTEASPLYHPIVVAPNGTIEVAAKFTGERYVGDMQVKSLRAHMKKLSPAQQRAVPEFVVVALLEAFAAGDAAAAIALYHPTSAPDAQRRFNGTMTGIQALHADAKHLLVQRTRFGDYVRITYVTKPKGGPGQRVWEETLIDVGGAYYLASAIRDNSFPNLMMQAIAEAQARGETSRTAAQLAGHRFVPVSIMGLDPVGVIGGTKFPITVAIAPRLAAPVVLPDAPASADPALQFLAFTRSLYADAADKETINALWTNAVEMGYDPAKPIDPWGWHSTQTQVTAINRVHGPQGDIFTVRTGTTLHNVFTTTAGGAPRLSIGLSSDSNDNQNPYLWTDTLLRQNVLMIEIMAIR